VPEVLALIFNISATVQAQNKKPHLSESPFLYGMVDLGKVGKKILIIF
jgi:hypothetical protein